MKTHTISLDPSMVGYKDRLYRELTSLHYEMDAKDRKSNTIKWVKENTNNDVSSIKELPDYEFDAIGKYAYLLNCGVTFDDKMFLSFRNHVNALCHKTPKADINEDITKPTIQDFIKQKSTNVCDQFDLWIDNFHKAPESFNFDIKKCKSCLSQLKAANFKHIVDYYQNTHDELTKAINGDEDILEGYRPLSLPQVRKLHGFIDTIFTTINEINSVVDEDKAKIDLYKAAAKVKYKAQHGVVTSIHPKLIVGSNTLWVFNTKSNRLGVYTSKTGLGLNGSGVTYEESQEKTIRDKSFVLKVFQDLSDNDKMTKFNSLAGISTKMNGKITEHHVLLGV